MSEINRLLRQLDQNEGLGELTLEAAPAPSRNPLSQPASVDRHPRVHLGAAASLAANKAAEPSPGTNVGTSKGLADRGASTQWRLPGLVLVGAAAIAAVAFLDPPSASPLTASSDASAPAAVVAQNVEAPMAIEAVAPTGLIVSANAGTAGPSVDASTVPVPAPAPAPASVPIPVPMSAAAPSARTSTGTRPVSAGASTGGSAATPVPMPASLAALPALATPFSTSGRIEKRNLAPTGEQSARVLMQNATELARTGQPRAALQRTREALEADPRHAPARQLAAILHFETGDTAAAVALLREGVELVGAPPALPLLLARLLAHQNQGREALTVLERHGLNSGEAEGLRASLLSQLGLYGRALVAFESALRQQPGNANWWAGMAVALESEGQGTAARQAYAQAQRLGLTQVDLATYVDQRLRALD